MTPIKLIALDLDGTIVSEQLEISPRMLGTLQYVIQETDIRVVIATGRMHESAVKFARKIGIREPLITYQGAMIKDLNGGNEVNYHFPIELDLARKVYEYVKSWDVDVNVYMRGELFTTHGNHFAGEYRKLSGIEPNYVNSIEEIMTEGPTKFLVIDDTKLHDLQDAITETFPDRLNYCMSRRNFFEIIDAQASKWNGIMTLANTWGIAPENILAIGDHENDLSMITQAGIGVAMGNAPELVKAQARYVTDSIQNDGAARAIEQFVLEPMSLEYAFEDTTSPLEASKVH
jgi:Cof subfamily protein (haloacid dehalogenase superfamily)